VRVYFQDGQGGVINLRVYWQNSNGAMVESKLSEWPWIYGSMVSNEIDGKSSFTAVELQSGLHHRVYVRESNSLVEKCNSDSDGFREWFNGAFRVG
jgi:hypothetical protein